MKCFLLTLFISYFNLNYLTAGNGFPCDGTAANDEVSIQDQMIDYLVKGTWKSASKTDEKYIHFTPNGKAEIIKFSQKTASHYIIGSWELRQVEDGAYYFQVTYNEERKMQKAEVQLTCGEITLINLSTGTKQRFQLEKPAPNLMKVTDGLMGKWQYANYTNTSNLKYLNYSFTAQGQYQIKIQKENYCTDELGSWNLSKDARFILLNPNDGSRARLIRIKYLESDELVLEHATLLSDNSISRLTSTFYNKI